MPMGFECACCEELQSKPIAHDGFDTLQIASNIDLTTDIAEANSLTDQIAARGLNGQTRILGASKESMALLRCSAEDSRWASDGAVILINSEFQTNCPIPIPLRPLPFTAGGSFSVREPDSAKDPNSSLKAGEVRVLYASRNAMISAQNIPVLASRLATAPRIAIENLSPSVDGRRFAVRRVIGERLHVEADVFTDGHDLLVVDLLWRGIDEDDWRRHEMRTVGNDRWSGSILPEKIGRHEFTVEAWIDKYGTMCRDLEVKVTAGSDVDVEIAEGCKLLERAAKRAQGDRKAVINSALNWLNDTSVVSAGEILTAAALREVMREDDHNFRVRGEPPVVLEVERPQAAFASWYELFPRSATDNLERPGTLLDVIGRLPMIKEMGFDVVYLPPIHPIGIANRKGKNNTLTASPSDVGSPYAIGGPEGGHDTIHPDLGTLEDFRALRDAAAACGLEIALDFAIQCSPDHPWLKQHPEWFTWRPDGSIRYAENPPKKYEDIVNVDFYATQAIPSLWLALCDIIFFWIDRGVRIFRVDNPHTKPLPFWEWMIEHVRTRYPEVIFLSEAFTRPKMMYRLAKLGFSQSYTYFTWRNSKSELTDYFLELTTSPVKEFFRPHLFVNTPDINPFFLQTSGRPGFLIRAALAATLSGLWGVYSGFELCESAALPGREEYLDSEKYEIRVRRHNVPGDIVSEISKLNSIRRSNSALQSHLGVRFYRAHNDQIILYGKWSPDREDMILVAVSLDPFHVQEAAIEIPLWEWHLPDDAAVIAHDLMRDDIFVWRDKVQHLRLDPSDLPFGIWRIAPHKSG